LIFLSVYAVVMYCVLLVCQVNTGVLALAVVSGFIHLICLCVIVKKLANCVVLNIYVGVN